MCLHRHVHLPRWRDKATALTSKLRSFIWSDTQKTVLWKVRQLIEPEYAPRAKISRETHKPLGENLSPIGAYVSSSSSSVNKQCERDKVFVSEWTFSVIRERKKFKGSVKFALFGYWQLLQSPGYSLFTSSLLIRLLILKLVFPPSLPSSLSSSFLPPCLHFFL